MLLHSTKSLFSLRIAEEVPGSHLHLDDFNNLEHVFAADEQVATDNGLDSARLHRHALRYGSAVDHYGECH